MKQQNKINKYIFIIIFNKKTFKFILYYIILYNIIMSQEFILLTQEDYNYLLKLKEQHQKRNAYHNEYN